MKGTPHPHRSSHPARCGIPQIPPQVVDPPHGSYSGLCKLDKATRAQVLNHDTVDGSWSKKWVVDGPIDLPSRPLTVREKSRKVFKASGLSHGPWSGLWMEIQRTCNIIQEPRPIQRIVVPRQSSQFSCRWPSSTSSHGHFSLFPYESVF